MSLRRYADDELNVSWKLRRRLRWICNAEGQGRHPDELAEVLLNEVIESRWPQIIPIEERLKEHEQEFADTFKEAQ